jgi:hypothetical protein
MRACHGLKWLEMSLCLVEEWGRTGTSTKVDSTWDIRTWVALNRLRSPPRLDFLDRSKLPLSDARLLLSSNIMHRYVLFAVIMMRLDQRD